MYSKMIDDRMLSALLGELTGYRIWHRMQGLLNQYDADSVEAVRQQLVQPTLDVATVARKHWAELLANPDNEQVFREAMLRIYDQLYGPADPVAAYHPSHASAATR